MMRQKSIAVRRLWFAREKINRSLSVLAYCVTYEIQLLTTMYIYLALEIENIYYLKILIVEEISLREYFYHKLI